MFSLNLIKTMLMVNWFISTFIIVVWSGGIWHINYFSAYPKFLLSMILAVGFLMSALIKSDDLLDDIGRKIISHFILCILFATTAFLLPMMCSIYVMPERIIEVEIGQTRISKGGRASTSFHASVRSSPNAPHLLGKEFEINSKIYHYIERNPNVQMQIRLKENWLGYSGELVP